MFVSPGGCSSPPGSSCQNPKTGLVKKRRQADKLVPPALVHHKTIQPLSPSELASNPYYPLQNPE
ncbi:hypothetical protein DEO72_LG8g1800 [Vigna unguiculata]|uniref:Uncharacterized protein n=1 Tax=Vigna unguiculata TaxID=3917 RepID=A0A4D6MSL4_VIGUN|nr:hypothetical protein DEO72_LG8g1800 [Vigna unguiculata]